MLPAQPRSHLDLAARARAVGTVCAVCADTTLTGEATASAMVW